METGHDLESQGRRCGVEVEPERQGRGEDCTLEEENSGTRYFPRFDVGDPTFVRFERYSMRKKIVNKINVVTFCNAQITLKLLPS